MIVTIHQANLMPWGPYFEKMAQADIFVILNHCQFEKNGYQNRFHIGPDWYTLSVHKKTCDIINKRYINAKRDWAKIKDKLPAYYDILKLFDDDITDSVALTNNYIIRRIAELLGVKTKIVCDSPTETRSTDRLVEIVKQYNGDKYIAGAGGQDYLDVSKFTNVGIQVEFQDLRVCRREPILPILAEKLNV